MATLDEGTKYDNADWSRCSRTGGVLIAQMAATGKAQGNIGDSLPCKGCWVQQREGNNTIKMSIGTEATAVFGVELGNTLAGAQPLWVPVSDISQLYFYGTAFEIVDIIYLLG